MKFNSKKANTQAITNHAGGKAYRLSPEMELYAAVVTAGLSDKYYEKAVERLKRIQCLMQSNKPEFVAKLALYARSEMYMRSIPLVLAVELAKYHSGDALVSKTVNGVVQRADEITELLAYYQLANARKGPKKLNKLSKQIQKGLVEAFNKFDEYQFGKYNRDGEVKLRDALFLVHPKAKDEVQQSIFNKIAHNELATPYTWETELSALGSQLSGELEYTKAKAVRAKWEELIDSNKVGYMALLRNLRNIIEADVSSAHFIKVCDYLSNANVVAQAKQFPFRYLAAYRELKTLASDRTATVLRTLEDAIMASSKNIKGFGQNTKVLIACDVSGSMQQPLSPKSKVLLYDVGLVLGMLLQSNCERVVTGMFGDTWKVVNVPQGRILANVDEFYRREGEVGYSTNGHKVIDDLISRKVIMDKVMIFTDCQLWNSGGGNASLTNSWMQYKKIAPKASLYLFDLAGHGQTPVKLEGHEVYLIAGWSDKVFDVLDALEEGTSAVQKIKQIVL